MTNKEYVKRKIQRRRIRKRKILMARLILLVVCVSSVLIIKNKIFPKDDLEIVAKENPSGEGSNSTSSGSKKEDNIVEKEAQIIPRGDEILPDFNITYEGNENAVDANIVANMLNGTYEGEEKNVFLTFDDGPSPLTKEVLDILEEKDVQATFFVLGTRIEEAPESKNTLRRILKEGNAIANHSYSHSMQKLYPGNSVDVNYFMEEFYKTNSLIREAVGEEFNTRILRMPGGYNSRVFYNDPNLPKFDSRLSEDGVVSLDWNALNGDAEGIMYSVEEMIEYIETSSEGLNNVVVLMHDTYGKEKTVEALPYVIDFYKERGYEFKIIK
ncbi:polysaccharide deacetylase family protein [Clostridium sp.]|uniref:polysaccharide deacetylase family protein n=1 Tax=Clostridium sp. TaxID=1506 RepID=UPI003F3CEA74